VFKKNVFSFVRICDILSFIFAGGLIVIGNYLYNWIYYDFLSILICVGGIKLFRFKNMKHAFLSMFTFIVMIGAGSGYLHFILTQSYNDYASDL
jgi:hypothetical protein